MVETCSLAIYNINKTVVLTCRSINWNWSWLRRWSCVKIEDYNKTKLKIRLLICGCGRKYRSADKSLTLPGRKQARKHVKNARDFNNIERRELSSSFSFSCMARCRRKFTPFWEKH